MAKSGRFHRLQWKLTFFYILTTIIVMVLLEFVAVLGFYVFQNYNTNKVLAMQVGTVALNAAEHFSGPFTNKENLDRALKEWPLEMGAEFQGYSAVIGPDGEVIAAAGDSLPMEPDIPGLPAEVKSDIRDALALKYQPAEVMEPVKTYMHEEKGAVYIVSPIANQIAVRGALVVKAEHVRLASQSFGQFLPKAFSFFGISLVGFFVGATIVGIAFGIVTSRSLVRRIRKILTSANRWSEGDFTVYVKDSSGDELGQLARRLNQMAGQLKELLRTRSDLATMEERNRLARELHDSIKQQMFAVSIWVSTGKSLALQDAEAARSHLAEAEQLIGHMQRELNALILELRPIAMEGKNLPGALEEYVQAWQAHSGIKASLEVSGEARMSPATEEALFRIAQEALSNAARHSGAGSVKLRLECGESAMLAIRDDGIGFEAGAAGRGVGLSSMRERMQALGGRLEVQSEKGKGTVITARVDLETGRERIS